jgi:flagella basal body P-ring formation protein FlgA
MKIIFSLCLFLSQALWACEIYFKGPVIVATSETHHDGFPLESQNCQEDLLKKLPSLMNDFSGDVDIELLSRIFTQESGSEVKVKAEQPHIKFIQLSKYIQQQFLLPEHTTIDAEVVNSIPLIALTTSSSLKLICEHCSFEKDEYLHLLIEDPIKQTFARIQIKAKVDIRAEAYELARPVAAFEENLKPSDFKRVLIKPNGYTKPFTEMGKIQFFRTNKMLRTGHVLSAQDLVPITLVKAGEKTEILFTNQNLSLKTFGIARQHGGMNDVIEVINPTNHKKYIGRVVENQKVEVKL